MTLKPLVVFGMGELAEVADFYFRHDAEREVVAFAADGSHLKENQFLGRPTIAFEEVELAFPSERFDLFVAIGYSKINEVRQNKCLAARKKGYELANYVSSRANIFCDLSHCSNCFILENTTIQPFARIGNGVIVWSGSLISHHSIIGDFAFIAPHVVITGGVTVGMRTFIGANSVINNHITVGKRCVIGSASRVIKNLTDDSLAVNTPAEISKVPASGLRGF
jgi:sugar O-acyltransferase (sialic acid O-acetyltransferase NeuD family)